MRAVAGVSSTSTSANQAATSRVIRFWVISAPRRSTPDTPRPCCSTAHDAVSNSSRPAGVPLDAATMSTIAAVKVDQIRRFASSNAAPSSGGPPSRTSWPAPASRCAVARTASATSGSTGSPDQLSVCTAIRSRAGSSYSSLTKGRATGGGSYFSPTSPPCTASSTRAQSRTVRTSANSTPIPLSASAKAGASETRPRLGLSPTRPVSAAGTRIEPPPSLPCATGSAREATSAAAPPEDPPVDMLGSQGLWAGPNRRGSVVVAKAISGHLLTATARSPARRNRRISALSAGAGTSPKKSLPACVATPAAVMTKSLIANGTPASTPSSAASSGSPNRSTVAARCGSTSSRARDAASTTSDRLTVPARTASVIPQASRSAYSRTSTSRLRGPGRVRPASRRRPRLHDDVHANLLPSVLPRQGAARAGVSGSFVADSATIHPERTPGGAA